MARPCLGGALKGVASFMFFLALLGVARPVQAQQLQEIQAGTRNVAAILGIPQEESGKCGTGTLILAHSMWNQLSTQVQQRILQVMQRPQMQKSRPSPSKRFLIHYDTTGSNTPSLVTSGSNSQRIPNSYEQYIDSVAYYFDYAWKLEVDTLGYLPPPSDGTEGGDQSFDIYVENLGSGLFGQTSWDPTAPLTSGQNERFATYIEIDNDFFGYRTPGMDGLRVTAAHEFHHSIQVGNYGIWSTVPNSDFYFYELTSTWMEHVAFPAVHDYYYYLPDYFQKFRDGLNRSLPFNTSNFHGYERVVWAHFLEKRFGRDIMRAIWTGIRSAPVLQSMANVLPQYGTTLESEFALFSSWNFFTADRADPQHYYSEGASYPRFNPNVSSSFNGMTTSISSAAPPLSTQFYQIALPSDTLTAIVTNVDVAGALAGSTAQADVNLNLASGSLQPPYQKVAGGLELNFVTNDDSRWRTLYLLSSTNSSANATSNPSPNPLRIAQDAKLVLPLGNSSSSQAEVFMVNGALELVYSHQYATRNSFGSAYVDVPTSDLRGAVGTGVYFVVARCGDTELKWKVAIIR